MSALRLSLAFVIFTTLLSCAPETGIELATDPALNRRALEAAMDEALRGLDLEIQQRAIVFGSKQVLVAPFVSLKMAPIGVELSWQLLRARSSLTTTSSDARFASTASMQAALRGGQTTADVFFLIDLFETVPPRFEVLAVSSRAVVRSGEVMLQGVEDFGLVLGGKTLIQQLAVPGAESLRQRDGQLWCESAAGMRELRGSENQVQLGESKNWDELRFRPAERFLGRQLKAPSFEWEGNGARLNVSISQSASGREMLAARLRRGGAALTLTTDSGASLSIRDARAWPYAASPQNTWLLLRGSGDEALLELHRRPLRLVPPQRATGEAGSVVAPIGVAAQMGEGWLASHGRVPMAWASLDDGVVSAPGIRVQHDEAHREWLFQFPTRDDAPLFRDALDKRLLALRSNSQLSWLVTPLGGELVSKGDKLRWRFEHAVPDLLERLAHPALWLDSNSTLDAWLTRHTDGSVLSGAEGAISQLQVVEHAVADVASDDLLRDEAARWVAGDRVSIALVVSKLGPPSARRQLATALWTLQSVDLFAVVDAQRNAMAPVAERPLSGLSTLEAKSAGEFSLYLSFSEGLLPAPELDRLGRRLKVLLNAAGIRLIWHAVGEEPVRVEAGALRARLMALPLYCDEPWLRALELASWAGESARVAALTDVEAMPLGSAGRRQAALALESALLSEGLVVPLWTERVGLAVAPGIRGVGPRLRGLAPLLREAAWSGGLRP